MGRKKEGILELLIELPWWVSVIFSAIIYIALKWILPSIQFENIFFKYFSQALPNMAGFVAIFFLLPAPISIFNSWRKKRLLDNQKGIESIRSLSWREFEEIIAEVFRRKGYLVIENSGTGPDGGVDVVLQKNENLFLVQCKQWKAQKVGVRIVREMYGVMVAKQATGVIIITSGFFTQEAQNFAIGKPIELMEGNQLASLIESTQSPNNNPARTEVEQELINICPLCGHQLVLRTARRGQKVGNKFYGCSSYPKCKFTKAYQG